MAFESNSIKGFRLSDGHKYLKPLPGLGFTDIGNLAHVSPESLTVSSLEEKV